ncbi:MAG: hypothetical protein K9N07_10780 [Candidatus Cloacimonetes bacterium]|nr:hypothetical protein [Candidatus Cloacimonadota bacterium]
MNADNHNSYLSSSTYRSPLKLSSVRIKFPEDFNKYKIEGVCEICIPNTMNINNPMSLFQTHNSDIMDYFGIDRTETLEFKPSATFNFKNKKIEANTRILVFYDESDENYSKWRNYKYWNLNSKEYNSLEKYHKDLVENDFARTGDILKWWFPTEIIKINGNSCIKYSYIYSNSSFSDQNIAKSVYIFNGLKGVVKITTSFVVSEKKIWKENFELALSTFSFKY